MSGPNGDLEGPPGAAEEGDRLEEYEYESINSMLDQINSCLDHLEERNDHLHEQLQELLELNREARREFQEQSGSQGVLSQGDGQD
ncbi:bublin coiled-coil protein [Lissotriton helveticus]